MTHDFTRNSSLSCDNLITSLGNKYNNTKNLPSKKAGCTIAVAESHKITWLTL